MVYFKGYYGPKLYFLSFQGVQHFHGERKGLGGSFFSEGGGGGGGGGRNDPKNSPDL